MIKLSCIKNKHYPYVIRVWYIKALYDAGTKAGATAAYKQPVESNNSKENEAYSALGKLTAKP